MPSVHVPHLNVTGLTDQSFLGSKCKTKKSINRLDVSNQISMLIIAIVAKGENVLRRQIPFFDFGTTRNTETVFWLLSSRETIPD